MACVAALAAVVAAGPVTRAAADDDRARAPADVASIDAALAAVQRDYPGRVLKVELERDRDGPSGWVYEVKTLGRGGRVIEVELDAVSLETLNVEGDRSGHREHD